jgi:hypothetical protein
MRNILHFQPKRKLRHCTSCGYCIEHHPRGHMLCRKCFGYEKIWQMCRRAILDITAGRP